MFPWGSNVCLLEEIGFLISLCQEYMETNVYEYDGIRGRMGSVVECLTRDHGVAVSSLTGVTALWSLSKTHLS